MGLHATRINTSLANLTSQSVQNRSAQLSTAIHALQREKQLAPAMVKEHLERILTINKDTRLWSGRRLREVNDALAIVSRRGTPPLARGSMPCNVIESFADDLKRLDIPGAVISTMLHDLRSMSSGSLASSKTSSSSSLPG